MLFGFPDTTASPARNKKQRATHQGQPSGFTRMMRSMFQRPKDQGDDEHRVLSEDTSVLADAHQSGVEADEEVHGRILRLCGVAINLRGWRGRPSKRPRGSTPSSGGSLPCGSNAAHIRRPSGFLLGSWGEVACHPDTTRFSFVNKTRKHIREKQAGAPFQGRPPLAWHGR